MSKLTHRRPNLSTSIALIAAMALTVLCGTIAIGAEQMITKITANELLAVMRQEGYSVEVDKDGDIVWTLNGYKALMLIPNGNSLQFYTSFAESKADLQRANTWNMNKRYSRCYIDKNGRACLELDLDLQGGVSMDRIRDFLSTCRDSFSIWYQEVLL